MLPPGIEQVYKGFLATLNWNYSLTTGLSLGVIKFSSDGIVSIIADGSAAPVNAKFQNGPSFSLTTKRASLFYRDVMLLASILRNVWRMCILMLLLVYLCYYWCNGFNLKLLYLKSDFTQTLVYLNPALNNPACSAFLLFHMY